MKPAPLSVNPVRTPVQQNKINHVTLVLDTSASMRGREKEVVAATDSLVQFLAKRSQEMDQETRITVYLFDRESQCIIYDKDVLRMPSISGVYHTTGPSTNLLGATIKAIDEAKEIPERYGDHAHLFYVFTDGHENAYRFTAGDLRNKIASAPDNYTLATLVPDHISHRDAESFGFPRANIQIWDTTKSVEEVGQSIIKSAESFYYARSTGVRSMKNLFSPNVANLNPQVVRSNLKPVARHDYDIFPIKRKGQIRDFVEYYTGRPYVKGNSYYQLTKPEEIQSYKHIAIREKGTDRVFIGPAARQILGIPDFDVKIEAASHPKYDIFVQSTSTNRNLMPATEVLVLKNGWM